MNQLHAPVDHKAHSSSKACPISKLTEAMFNNRVQQLLSQGSLYDNAMALKEKLQKENGLQATIELLESWDYTRN